MPQSKGGTYSVYVDDKDRVWATDWLANAIQRFDPATEKFATFPSDKRGANVRQMLGRPGEAWGGEVRPGSAGRRARLEHDPESGNRFSEKIMFKQKARP